MKKYIHYTAIDFSQEPSFIRWVHDRVDPDDMDWTAYAAEYPGQADVLKEARRIVESIQFDTVPVDEGIEEKIWQKIDSQTAKQPATSRRSVVRWLSMATAAAAAIALVLIINTGDQYDTTINTDIAEVTSYDLPDGSSVTINAGSELKFDKENWAKKRQLHLDGEAFFEVERGSKFTVITDNGEVEVLGTSFNVLARGKSLQVICETGKVEVRCRKRKTILTPNEAVHVLAGVHTMRTNVANSDKRSNWLEGVYVYKASPLTEVLAEVERQFSVSVTSTIPLRQQSYTGSFSTANLETALESVLWPLSLTYEVKGSEVIITN